MSDTARCPFCQKYIDVTFKLESCPKCNKSLAGIELKNEVVESHKMASLYALWATMAYVVIVIIVLTVLSKSLAGIEGNSCGSGIGVAIIISITMVYTFVDKYFSEKK
jgi:hypothetical protein